MKIRLLIGIPFLVLLGCIAFIALKKIDNRGVTILRFAYASNPKPVKDAIDRFALDLEKKSEGKIRVLVFPDGQLGGERELVELTQTGAVNMTKVSAGLLESFSPQYGVFSMPYLFDSETHFYRSMEERSIVDPIYQSTAPLRFVGLTYYDSGQRSFYTRDKAIRTPDDLKGLKIRVMQNMTSIKMVSALGGSPIAMNNSETYSAIQQGIIDGAESNEFAITVPRHGEVAKQYSYDMHTRVPDIVIINSDNYAKLPADLQQLLRDTAKQSTDFQKTVWHAAIDDARQQAKREFNVAFNEDVDIKSFQAAVAPMYEELKQKPAAYGIYQQIRAIAPQ